MVIFFFFFYFPFLCINSNKSIIILRKAWHDRLFVPGMGKKNSCTIADILLSHVRFPRVLQLRNSTWWWHNPRDVTTITILGISNDIIRGTNSQNALFINRSIHIFFQLFPANLHIKRLIRKDVSNFDSRLIFLRFS